MNDQLVSLEVAKLLKENGFVNLSDKSYVISEGARYGLLSNFTNKCNNSVETDRVEAPTQSLAQKWLREKHGIDITIALVATGYGFYIHKNRNYTNNGEHYDILVPTYEEALEAALLYVLKNLI